MKQLSAILLFCLLCQASGLDAFAKRARHDAAESKGQDSSAEGKADATSNAKPKEAGDVTQSLDELLSSQAKSAGGKADADANSQSATDKALHGGVEDSQMLLTSPVVPDRQPGKSLQGQANQLDNGLQMPSGNLQPLQPKQAPVKKPVLQGSAVLNGGKLSTEQDPDMEDRELMVEWDKWRNRLLRAVQLQVQAGVNNPDSDEDARPRIDFRTGQVMPRFPMGTEAWFYCEVTSDRRIKVLKITQSSGFSSYDRAIIEGVRALEGTSLLQFPRGSRRLIVNQEAGIKTAAQADYTYYHFGDVERFKQ